MGLFNIKMPVIESRALTYGYSNARVRGMKGLLLKPAFLDELIKVRTIDAMVELLQRTHYKEYLVSLSLTNRGSLLVERASAKHLADVLAKVRAFAPKRDIKVIDAFLRRWDFLNLKILINAIRLGKSFDDIKTHMFPVGTIPEKNFEKISGIPEFFDELRKTEIGKLLLAINPGIFSKKSGNLNDQDRLMNLQFLLDGQIYNLIMNALETGGKDLRTINRILKKEIDAKNILVIFRLKSRNISKEKTREFIIGGGTMADFTINQMIGLKDLSSVGKIISSKFKGLEIKENTSLVDLEIALEKSLAAEKLAIFGKSILSLGVLLGFLLLKEEELNNLRKIAKGKEFNLPEEEIRNMLVVV